MFFLSNSYLYCSLGCCTNVEFDHVFHFAFNLGQAARDGFCSQVKGLSDVERETSISINREVDLGKTALYIAAEDDSLISHSSVPLPVDAFLARLDDLSMDYCSHFSSSFRSSPETILDCLERYLYVNKVHVLLINVLLLLLSVFSIMWF